LIDAFTRISALSASSRPGALLTLPDELRPQVEELLAAAASPLAESLERHKPLLPGTMMSLQSHLLRGFELGPYTIETSISGEGLGVVFRARDNRDGQTVAIKILAPDLATNSAWLSRFEREMQALRQTRHPGIVRILEDGNIAGFRYFSMELVEGRTLRAVMCQGPIEPSKATRWIGEIADALRAAHREGFLHNDLKPENIMVQNDGHIVLLDFGLTRPLVDNAPVNGSVTSIQGTISGTIRYLSPERVAGNAPGVRSDIFSLGILLREMLTGQPPFARPNPLAVAAAILHEQPSPLPAGTPHMALIARCLNKQPDRRPQTVDAFLAGLNPRRKLHPLWWIAASVLVLLACYYAFAPKPVPEPLRLDAALSPDGRYLVYTSNIDNRERVDLYLDDRATGQRRRITSTPDVIEREPSFSPDSKRITYMTMDAKAGGVFVLPVDGSAPPKQINPRAFRPRWSPDGRWILFTTMPVNGISLKAKSEVRIVPSDGSAPSRSITEGINNARMPIWMPDGTVLLAEYKDGSDVQFRRIDPNSGRTIEVFAYTLNLPYLLLQQAIGPREVLCVQHDRGPSEQGKLMAFSLDQRDLRPVGPRDLRVRSASVAANGEGVALSLPRNRRIARLALDGKSAPTWEENLPAEVTGYAIDRQDRSAYLVADSKLYRYNRLTRQAQSLGRKSGAYRALLSHSPQRLFWTGDSGESLQREAEYLQEVSPHSGLTSLQRLNSIAWDIAPTGDRILRATASAPHGIEIRRLEPGQTAWSAPESIYSLAPRNLYLGSYSPDGKWISFVAETMYMPTLHYIAPVRPGLQSDPSDWILLPENAGYGVWSIDMRRYYFVSQADGHFCLYAIDMDPATGKPVSTPQALRHYHDLQVPLVSNLLGQFRLSASSQALYYPVTAVESQLVSIRTR
jgi:serine/threonine protein kinase